jgi:hypothetical protein
MLNQRKKHALEILTIFVYAALLAFISYFHEPWFDEAQAWLIARDSSLLDMIWNVLRYEGHTPLWHLFLFIPTHLGIPFELGLKSINLIFATLAAAVFIKYSPFPLAFRLLTPFTYFLFYQYGVISRSYSLFMLVLWLIAAAFPKRNERPYLFFILLALLGGISAYGMLIVFGFGLAWFIEITREYHKNFGPSTRTIAIMASDSRIHSLILVGFVHIFYVAILWPMQDKHTPPLDYYFTAAERIYRLLMAPVGALFLSESYTFLTTGFDTPFALLTAVVGLALISIYILWSIKKGIFYYVVLPYICLTSFMTFGYFSIHHTGIYALLIVFSVWISYTNGKIFPTPERSNSLPRLTSSTVKKRGYFKTFITVGLFLVLSLQLYWSFTASMNDIRLSYAPYRELAVFIKTHDIDQYRIFDYYYLSNKKNTYFTNNLAALAYFHENIFYNHNPNKPDISYAAHQQLSDDGLINYLKTVGAPDFIIHRGYDLPFYDELFSLSDYSPVKAFESFYMWKDQLNPDSVVIFIRKDLLEKMPEIWDPID